jgi:hypothetical protein
MPEPDTFATLPDPAQAGSLGDLVDRLRLLKVWAGDPSYETIKDRVNAAWAAAGRPAGELTRRSTVANCFQSGRRRMNTDLVLAVVEALHPNPAYMSGWRQALRVITGQTEAVGQVPVHASLPEDLAGFTGRAAEFDRLRQARHAGDAVVISAVEGMAGVGKTRLAVHAGHRLHRQEPFERVLFVKLRGFHPDRTQRRPTRRRYSTDSSGCSESPPAGYRPAWPPGPPSTATGSPASVLSWCWTTPPPPARSSRSCRPRRAASPWSPAGTVSPV